jgi:hypothetical protein
MNKKIRRIKKRNSIEHRKYLKEMKIIEDKFKFIKYRRGAFKKILTETCIAMGHLHKCKPIPGKKYGKVKIECYEGKRKYEYQLAQYVLGEEDE